MGPWASRRLSGLVVGSRWVMVFLSFTGLSLSGPVYSTHRRTTVAAGDCPAGTRDAATYTSTHRGTFHTTVLVLLRTRRSLLSICFILPDGMEESAGRAAGRT